MRITNKWLSVLVAFAAILSVVGCAQKKSVEKPKYIWMCLDANFERFTSQDSIRYYMDKAKETGFNHIVVDVRGCEGSVLYNSEFIPQLTTVEGFTYQRDWDYLQFFIDEARKRDLGVTVSASIFPSGSPYTFEGPAYTDPEVAKMTCLQYTPNGMSRLMDDQRKVGAFLNPVLPESREYAKRMIREILTNYKFDGFALDYCRFPDADSDFSDASREAFEAFLGKKVERFPEDIFTYDENGARVPGLYYKEWWQFRGEVIRNFVADVRTMVDELQPGVQLEYWAASWLHAIYTQGQNWASPRSRFYEEYLNDWATPDYYKTAFADQLDVFITGTYLERVWGADDNESIEYGLNRTLRDIDGDCAVYGSLYAQNKNQFEDAVYLCLSKTEGLMVFDIVQVIESDMWAEIKRGIDRAEAEAIQ